MVNTMKIPWDHMLLYLIDCFCAPCYTLVTLPLYHLPCTETGGSYYKQIDGVKYDKGLLEKADSLTTGRGDGRISQDDAEKLWEDAQDGKGVTECESRTLQYILENYNCTDAGKEVLKAKMGGDAAAAEENKGDSAEANSEGQAEGGPAEDEPEEVQEEEKESKRKSRGDDVVDDDEEEVEQEAEDDEAAREVETQDMREAKLAMQEAAQWLANEDRRARKKSRRYADYA